MSGAERLAYPPVVAGGGNSLILHYVSCDEVLREGDMVLVDGGVELNHYVSDVTRVWPVGGGEEGFSERQREVYEVVRGVVDLCVGKCRSGVGMMEVHSVGVGGLVLGLKKLGFFFFVFFCFVLFCFVLFCFVLFCFVLFYFVCLLFIYLFIYLFICLVIC